MAKLLGISAEAIRYYESRNIIQPVRDPETGYRYYNTWDFHMLLRARHYQNYGFSLEEVADLFCSRELSGIQAQMGMQEAGIQREIVRQINLLKHIRQHHVETVLRELYRVGPSLPHGSSGDQDYFF